MRALDSRLVRRARPARLLLTVDAAIGLVAALLVICQAALLALVVARAFDGADADELWVYILLLAAAFAGRGVLAWLFEVAGRRASAQVLSELRMTLTERRLEAQPAALDGVEAAEVVAATVQGIDGLEAYYARYLPQVVLACVVPVAVLAAVAVIDLQSALVMLVTLPLVPLFMWLIGVYTEHRTRERWRSLRLLSTHFLDVIRGLPTLRAFNRGRSQTRSIAQVTGDYRHATMATLRVAFLSSSVLELAATLGVALVAVTVGVRLADGGLELQAGLTVLVLAPELYLPLRRLGAEFHASADGVEVADRIFTLLEAPAESPRGGTRIAPSPATAPVRFEGVSFSYPTRPGLVLDDLELELLPGETVALVGASGSGKSTICSLLLRLAQPTAGRITLDGVDLAVCDTDSWHRFVAWVPQRPSLIRGTVAENIRLGELSASNRRVAEVAALAGADEFIQGLPQGYDTVVGDGGRPLSLGQRRRLALARAFMRKAPLIVLDEPTADLDRGSADIVGQAIERLGAGRSVLLVAHRAELAGQADRVLVLEDGKASVLMATEAA